MPPALLSYAFESDHNHAYHHPTHSHTCVRVYVFDNNNNENIRKLWKYKQKTFMRVYELLGKMLFIEKEEQHPCVYVCVCFLPIPSLFFRFSSKKKTNLVTFRNVFCVYCVDYSTYIQNRQTPTFYNPRIL